jgi:hypothetical protein
MGGRTNIAQTRRTIHYWGDGRLAHSRPCHRFMSLYAIWVTHLAGWANASQEGCQQTEPGAVGPSRQELLADPDRRPPEQNHPRYEEGRELRGHCFRVRRAGSPLPIGSGWRVPVPHVGRRATSSGARRVRARPHYCVRRFRRTRAERSCRKSPGRRPPCWRSTRRPPRHIARILVSEWAGGAPSRHPSRIAPAAICAANRPKDGGRSPSGV